MDSSAVVREFVRKEVSDWDNDVIAMARFKAFSGQRSDWETKYLFWKQLILKAARHLGIFIIQPSQVKNEWFSRGGLTPLCLDHVLFLMYNEGDIVRSVDLMDPTSGRLSQLVRKMKILMVRSTITPDLMLEDHVILTALLKDKAAEVIKLLSESHWTASCIVTLKKFQSICGGPREATAVLSYLSGLGKARYISISRKDLVEGVKISISPAPVSAISSLDCDVLHLIWTTERLRQQLDVIDQRYEISRKSALASLNSGNKKVALRHAREMKLATENREKCSVLLNRVEEILNVIANAESTKKVTEAIQIGAQAMKQNKISVEEVEICLEELDESIDAQKQVEKTLESTPLHTGLDDEDFEEELRKLELEVGGEDLQPVEVRASNTSGEGDSLEFTGYLTDAMSNLKLQDKYPIEDSAVPKGRTNESNHGTLEAA